MERLGWAGAGGGEGGWEDGACKEGVEEPNRKAEEAVLRAEEEGQQLAHGRVGEGYIEGRVLG